MRRRTLWAATLVLFGVTILAAVQVTAAQPSGDRGSRVDEPLVELATCAGLPAPAEEDESADDVVRPGSDIVVRFVVPATTRVEVEQGAVVAATTNTGCAPRPDDVFVVVPSNRLATPAERADALQRFQSGDWRQPAIWHRASAQSGTPNTPAANR